MKKSFITSGARIDVGLNFLVGKKVEVYPILGDTTATSFAAFEWRFASGPMVARLQMLTGLLPVAISSRSESS